MSTDLRAALDHGEVRRVITNAYYDARNEGETMEVAADRAADAVMALATTPERCPRCGVRGDDPGMIAEGAVGATRCPRCGKWNRNSSATPEPAPALRATLERLIEQELESAYAKHGREQWGRHEFYAILKEEVDELWDAIKADEPQDRVRDEAIQIAAMVLRYLETGDRYRGEQP